MSQASDMAIFFTSDTHFGHGGALGLYQRSFPSVVAMNEAIVERWNATVGPDDEVSRHGSTTQPPSPLISAPGANS